MFGFRFIKVQPTTYLLQYSRGKLKREGQGLTFFYFSPMTSLVAVPLESVDAPFIFNQVTSDFQSVSIQGQVTYRVVDPKKLAQLLNFTLDSYGQYVNLDHDKLPQRIINLIQVVMQSMLATRSLRETLKAANQLVKTALEELSQAKEINALGLEILGLSILSIQPTPETARALEADVREQLLKEADHAIYARRNAAVEQERAIKENELNTEIAIENKNRQIREAQMDAEYAVQEKQQQLHEAEMEGKIVLEKRNKELIQIATENLKAQADAKAYTLTVTMQALANTDPKTLQVLSMMGMEPNQLISLAFRELAESANKIGELNVSPELLQGLLKKR